MRLRLSVFALTHPARPTPLPEATPSHLRDSPFHTDDPRVDLALENAMKSFGTIGYQRTRLMDIAKATGVSDGFILLRYKTKLGLLQAIVNESYAQGYQELIDFQQDVAARFGPGIAEAVAWREYLDPRISDRQMLGMETDRLSLFNPAMREIAFDKDLAVLEQQLNEVPAAERSVRTGDTHLDFAAGHGLPAIGLILPEIWTLPFNVVTEPYVEGANQGQR